MLAVVKDTTTTFLLPQPLACLEDWQPLEFYLEFQKSQTDEQPKGFGLNYVLTAHNGYEFTFTEAPTDDLNNQTIYLGNVGDQWDATLYQSNGLQTKAKKLMLERVQVYAAI